MFDRRIVTIVTIAITLCLASVPLATAAADESQTGERICRPRLGECAAIELGRAGIFGWTCSGGMVEGSGFYVVFVRPSGTYVVLKVPHGRTSFEFTPDAQGQWRWIVINTDPDGTKPDVESDAGHFQVLPAGATLKNF